MRHIGTIPDLDSAELFADYLASKEISIVAEPQGSEWLIWVKEEDRLAESQGELDDFLANPTAAKYVVGANIHRAAMLDEPTATEELEAPPQRPRSMRDVASQAPLTVAFVALSVVVAGLSHLGQELHSIAAVSLAFCDPRHLDNTVWAADPNGWIDIQHGQLWRLVTPVFLHLGLAHLTVNLFFLFQLGWLIESKHSTRRVALIFFICALVGNVAQYLCDGWPLFGGSSGIVCGLLSFIWIRMRTAPQEKLRIAPLALALILCSLTLAGNIDQIANTSLGNDVELGSWNELFGLISGAIMAAMLPVSIGQHETLDSESHTSVG